MVRDLTQEIVVASHSITHNIYVDPEELVSCELWSINRLTRSPKSLGHGILILPQPGSTGEAHSQYNPIHKIIPDTNYRLLATLQNEKPNGDNGRPGQCQPRYPMPSKSKQRVGALCISHSR